MNKLMMAADKLKKIEARGRAAFIQGDITSATRYFLQALEKQGSGEYCKRKEVNLKCEKLRSKSLLSLNNNDEDLVWKLQSSPAERKKKNDKANCRKKKEDKESCIEMLDGIIADADTAIETFPSYPMGYLRKASALIVLNQWEEARATYTTGLQRCNECSILKSALYNLNRTHKLTSCAANLDMKQLSDLVKDSSSMPTILPPRPTTLRRNRFCLQGQRRLTKKIFPRETAGSSLPQIQAMSFRRRNSSSTETHL